MRSNIVTSLAAIFFIGLLYAGQVSSTTLLVMLVATGLISTYGRSYYLFLTVLLPFSILHQLAVPINQLPQWLIITNALAIFIGICALIKNNEAQKKPLEPASTWYILAYCLCFFIPHAFTRLALLLLLQVPTYITLDQALRNYVKHHSFSTIIKILSGIAVVSYFAARLVGQLI